MMPGHSISMTISIIPRAQMRARHRIVKTKDGRTFSTTYKAKEQLTEEQKFIAMLYQHKPDELITGPVWLRVKAFMPIPESKPKKWKGDAVTGHIRPVGKPDLSNLIKFVEDCMNGVFWKDDSQIVEYIGGTGRYYSLWPRWEIMIMW